MAKPLTLENRTRTQTVGDVAELPVTNRLNFAPIRGRRAFEEVCDQIRAQIATGKLRPGDRLPAERILGEQFKVSRTAIREAFKALEVAGVVRTETGVKGGSFIRDGDPEVVTLAIRDMLQLNKISIDS